MIHNTPIPTIVVIVAALIATTTDIWKYKVYNTLTFPLLTSGLIYNTYLSDGLGLLRSLAGIATGFGILIIFYWKRGMGAGDVKLMAGVGAWLGVRTTFYVFIASSLAAGIYAIVAMTLAGTIAETWVNVQMLWIRLATIGRVLGDVDRVESAVNRADRRRRVIPFAAMVTLGMMVVWIWDVRSS